MSCSILVHTSLVKFTSVAFYQDLQPLQRSARHFLHSHVEVAYFRCLVIRQIPNLMRNFICYRQSFHCNRYQRVVPHQSKWFEIFFKQFPSLSTFHRTNCQELRDATGTRLTLVYPGKMYRVSVPLVCESVLVTKCLEALRKVLQKELAIHVSVIFFFQHHQSFISKLSVNHKMVWNSQRSWYQEFQSVKRMESLYDDVVWANWTSFGGTRPC